MLGSLIAGGLSWLFGNSKSADKAVDTIADGLDNAFFTDQEKTNAGLKILDFKIRYAEATQNQSIARRVIAFIVSSLWALLVMVAVVTGFFNDGEGSFSSFVFSVLDQVVNPPFMIVIGFYFAAHVVKGLKQ